ncbi:murein transglycosylase C [Actinobacillus delphinicola]|uniref:Murein transglycosylase C n=1 Tax=Actinobacillus delphinicola TaxID=51161 RepID=A0A448TST8_9PAST|nr:membrane-bound lytic murein transglycosylase MltC [Actinobacillus delphinicola]MDG6897277.1 murein transglycosylase C [Actinobacillus delphinicola]VEJ09097.1 murein transglycosylase C [Actinobacillus delphinicola]
MKKYLIFALAPFLFACASKTETPELPPLDTKGLDILVGQFSHNIDDIWGVNELLVASRQDYVKYTDQYKTRSHINFEQGLITIGTLGTPKELQHAIVHTLLMGENADSIDLFASGDVPISDKPFLKDLVMDQKGKTIDNVREATAFANYLIKNRLQTRRLQNGRIEHFVEIPMVANHVALRAKSYLPLVRQASRRYNVDESLILAIMQVESSFNPYAVSYSNAVGLMQIVRTTAGRDVFKHQNRPGAPSKHYLLNPRHNIDIGTHYLSLLKNKYLAGIKDKDSLRYAVIASYNSGAGAVLRIFDKTPQNAINKINRLSPQRLYNILEREHPSLEARRYLMKVSKAQKNYRVIG